MEKIENKRLLYAAVIPLILCLIMVLVFIIEHDLSLSFVEAGVFPRELKTLPNLLTMPFVHSNLGHLVNNLVPMFVLNYSLYYFYSAIANRVLLLMWLFAGMLLWIIGRDSWHIGASGIIYAISTFLVFSGIFRRYIPLISISLIVVFLYGGNVWHLFPWEVNDPISWEGHLSGGVVGLVLSIIFRHTGPQKPEMVWDEEETFVWYTKADIDDDDQEEM